MQKALAAELQAQGFHVVCEVPVVVQYTTSLGQTVAVGTVRLDIEATTPAGDVHVLELKVTASKTAAAAAAAAESQVYKYAALLPQCTGLHLVVFAADGPTLTHVP